MVAVRAVSAAVEGGGGRGADEEGGGLDRILILELGRQDGKTGKIGIASEASLPR